MIVEIPVSVGELVDKITILRIKSRRIADSVKLENVNKELQQLNSVFGKLKLPVDILPEFQRLENINNELWNVEDKIREKEKNRQFDEYFIATARLVYVLNDERASIKKEINMKVGSDLVEEKSYSEYTS
jgi:tRNA A37 threonylcarbamoyladenosine dehydratase